MTNGMIVKEQSDSTNNLRSIFDQSLAILCDVKGSLKNGDTGRTVAHGFVSPTH